MSEQSVEAAPANQERPGRLGVVLVAGMVGLGTLFGAFSLSRRDQMRLESPDPPELFNRANSCPEGPRPEQHARRFERHALLREERYPYDSRDGVLAVKLYERSGHCYQRAGASADSGRVQREATRLKLLVNTDYAAIRLSFANALASERWSAASADLRRLLRLTEHLEDDEYVHWLRDKVGALAVRSRTRS